MIDSTTIGRIMISRTGNRLRLLALAAFGFLAIPSGHAHAQVMRRAALAVNGKSAKARDSVDSSTLTGKLIMGYQGWFNCPGDGTKVGWWHWFTGPRRARGLAARTPPITLRAEQCVARRARRRRQSGESAERREPGNGGARNSPWTQQDGLDEASPCSVRAVGPVA